MARAKKFVEVQLLYLQGNQVEGWSIQHELKKSWGNTEPKVVKHLPFRNSRKQMYWKHLALKFTYLTAHLFIKWYLKIYGKLILFWLEPSQMEWQEFTDRAEPNKMALWPDELQNSGS